MAENKNDEPNVVEELVTDPDSPDKGNSTPPPQTIDAEPSQPDKDAR